MIPAPTSLHASTDFGASLTNRPIPPHSSASKCGTTTYASLAGSTNSATALRTSSYNGCVPVWISAGRSSTIRNWLKLIPYCGSKALIR